MTAESKTEKLKMNIHQRINAIMGDLDYVQKEDKKVNNQYTFASHDAVTAALHPLFVRHRITCNASVLSHTQDGNLTCVDLLVTYTNIDKPDDTLIVNYFVPALTISPHPPLPRLWLLRCRARGLPFRSMPSRRF